MERRIEVRTAGMEREIEWDTFGCEACGVHAGVVYAEPSLGEVLHAAEVQGLDVGRPFRMLPHLALDYVEFWQVPLPVPNEAWAQQPVLEAAS